MGFAKGKCPRCYQREWIQTLSDEERAKRRKRYNITSRKCRTDKRNYLLEMVREIKSSQGCIDCGIKDWRVLEFDHVRGEKIASISGLIRHKMSEEMVLEEIDKCEVRCANCHRIKTIERLET